MKKEGKQFLLEFEEEKKPLEKIIFNGYGITYNYYTVSSGSTTYTIPSFTYAGNEYNSTIDNIYFNSTAR